MKIMVEVTWSGGNGPHVYRLGADKYEVLTLYSTLKGDVNLQVGKANEVAIWHRAWEEKE